MRKTYFATLNKFTLIFSLFFWLKNSQPFVALRAPKVLDLCTSVLIIGLKCKTPPHTP